MSKLNFLININNIPAVTNYSLGNYGRKISALGYDDKFIRTREYYFAYAAADFKSRMLGNYQVKFVNIYYLEIIHSFFLSG